MNWTTHLLYYGALAFATGGALATKERFRGLAWWRYAVGVAILFPAAVVEGALIAYHGWRRARRRRA